MIHLYFLILINIFKTTDDYVNLDYTINKSTLNKCKHHSSKYGYFKFLFDDSGRIHIKKHYEFVGICFQKLTAKLIDNEDHFLLEFSGKNKVSILCNEIILISNYQYLDYLTMFTGYNKTLRINKIDENFNNYVMAQGFDIMTLCDSLSHLIPNIISTIKLYFGGFGTNPKIPIFGSHISKYQLKANKELVEMFTGYEWKKLKNLDTIDYDKFDSGDLILITRFDGIDNMIGIGTGSKIGHCTIILKENNETYVYESQDIWYWPKPNIQKNKLSTWIKWAKNADYNVIWVPLSEKYKKKFNVKKGKEFADSLLGQEYGYRNFIFGWIDTKEKNFPFILNLEFLFFTFRIIEKLSKKTSDLIFTEAINFRLNTKNLSLEQISKLIVKNNLDLGKIMTIPEKDGYKYSNGVNYVCSSYVAAILKAGNIFDNLELNATEMTPRDLYTLNIYNKKIIKGCNNKPYCQFLGKEKIELDQFSTRDPYNHMYEKCETQAPDFIYNKNC